MKKTTNITIGGVVFHIEEDGYKKLSDYLISIQKYFSSFAESQEILADIEGRIAEKFIAKQKAENKQVISLENVNELIKAMGTVSDFEAIEKAEDLISDPLSPAAPKETKSVASAAQETSETPKRFFRDMQRKMIGGVASGIGHHFKIDTLWIRLGLIMLAFGFFSIGGLFDWQMDDFLVSLSGVTILVYIAMWVAFPGSSSLQDDKKIKKFYRNPDGKVIGGVAAGVASYFSADVGVIRFLWVLSILLFGSGILLYIVLWVIAPPANTLTEKMELQGEPITLSNIETNIKKGLNVDPGSEDENTLTRILLFPFRFIALVLAAIGKLLKGAGPILRILIGGSLIASAGVGIFVLIVLVGIVYGVGSNTSWGMAMGPIGFFKEIPDLLFLTGAWTSLALLVIILLLGITLIANKPVVGTSVWLMLLAGWIGGMIGTSILGFSFAENFNRRAYFVNKQSFELPAGTLVLNREKSQFEEQTIDTKIRLRGSANGDSLRMQVEKTLRGGSREEALERASRLPYTIYVKDSVFSFPEGPAFSEETGFMREPRINIDFFVPYDNEFAMSSDFFFNALHWKFTEKIRQKYDLERDDINWDRLRWVMDADSGLICTNISKSFLKTEDADETNDEPKTTSSTNPQSELDLGSTGPFVKDFPLANFDKIEVDGAYMVRINHGTDFKVSIDGEESNVQKVNINVENETLTLKPYRIFFKDSWERVGITITLPSLRQLDLLGANLAVVTGFDNEENFELLMKGASKAEIDLNTRAAIVKIVGVSKATFLGEMDELNAELSGACQLEATQATIENAEIKANGASHVTLGHVNNLRKETNGASTIESAN